MTNYEKVHEKLNGLIATEAVFMFKMYHRHFYVKGSHFFTLHKQFEKLYEEAADTYDEFSERLLSIGGRPYSTMAQCLEHSTIEEHPQNKDVSDTDMVDGTVEDLRKITKDLMEGITMTGEIGDDTTQDMLIAKKQIVDKHIWMFEAFLDQSVRAEETMPK